MSEIAGLRDAARWPAAPRAARILSVLALAASSLVLASCQEQRVFGMPMPELREVLAGDDASPMLRLDDRSLGEVGPYGPAAWYCLALWLESRAGSAQAGPAAGTPSAPLEAASAPMRLLRLAYGRSDGIVKERAAAALMERLGKTGDHEGLLALTEDLGGVRSGDWKARRARLSALDALGRSAEAMDELTRLRLAFPEESAADADALSCIEAAALIRAGSPGGAARAHAALREIALRRPASEWTARALELASGAAAGPGGSAAALSADEARVARMRLAVRAKDYDAAYREAAAAPRAAVAASSAALADAGKAYLYSGRSREGAERFAAIEGSARESGDAALAWTARFYLGRFARAREEWSRAAALFGRAASSAASAGVSPANADAASWYAAECAREAADAEAEAATARAKARPGSAAALSAARKARAKSLDALVAASRTWSDPAAFSDLADDLLRDALRGRDFGLVERMRAELAPRLTPTMKARIAYAAARVLELGLAEPAPDGARDAAALRDRFASIARDEAAPLYYRALASWRSGESVSAAPAESSPSADGDQPDGLESFIRCLADFGLGGAAAAEARDPAAPLDPAALRRVAARLAEAGLYDGSLQVASALVAKKDYSPVRDDYYLLYPRPYLKEIRGLESDPRVDERLVLGLVRSESAFMAGVRSRAGAVGLTQLMPATAAEQAKAMRIAEYDLKSPRAGAVGLTQLMPATAAEQAKSMRIAEYDLKSPRDNLRIGIAHFAYLLKRSGSPLRAMMAYNAGMTRLAAWAAAAEGLPDDLLVETLTIAETRQYCRNIVQAAAMYGELYEGVPPGATAGRLAEGRR